MYCQECKVNHATIHLTQNIQGEISEIHLCEECAAKKGALLFDVDNKFSIPNLLSNFFGYNYNIAGSKTPSSSPVCPNCNMKFSDIRRTGKLGCSECYTAFEQVLEPSLRRIHGNSRHIGRIPLRGGGNVLLKRKINELKDKLQKAVVNEEYETAAEIRDEIKKLEKDLA
ncbi:MAG TPA: UvrB/UvrC motif-containing protein [Syntrophomonadaceae bacterium]|nr:UvrB/UvrC motif-containing protein [Syntrophomonadaceae bacterium]